MARKTNINAVLNMVKEFLDGDGFWIFFAQDFPLEVVKRYDKMCREDYEWAEMIMYYLVEKGADQYVKLDEEQFRALMEEQLSNVLEGVY